MEHEKLSTGTTTVGIVCKDCVVMGSDRRVTAGNYIMAKDYRKITAVADNIVLTISGVVSDVQLVIKYLKSELKLKNIRTGRRSTLKEAANLLSSWNYSMLRSNYSISHFLVGGFDKTSGLYDVTPDGALKEHVDYVASGSGSLFSIGVLENDYTEGLSADDGVKLVVRALNAALQRDSASGNGVDVYVIDKDGAHHVVDKEINMKISV